MLLIVTAIYLIFVAMIGKAISNKSNTTLVDFLLIALMFGSLIAFCFLAVSIIPGAATIVGAFLLTLVACALGAHYQY
ncbi:MAG: hypothetical protein UW41_C0012G0007 [Candidatus Collierbacteria bacterium GW2011_GWC2_44_18]|uniref:Uncharacterized protein n=1 Tax=Candidatus Collierbacteria bacterium GW2011_GWC2_44_18 TaxID=1618392 RepID=A0A0G1KM80_9BACT|nr:MAG: hypothetical protein UW16_C0031G0015 [Microgenomates group bacterium GW2011_GWC1_44_10]KKT49069.1 MAG: hypothetical protein UW41_C0012G0007 [Candidatus Collierbacteria bacterium GW2011_GWC2_44_18]